jgi:uncharacterized phage-associated protein
MYDLRAIANYFIEKGIKEGKDVSPMKLQKLMYFACGLYLASKDDRLFSDRFEVWPWGPVISSLYHTVKSYGSRSIDRPILELDLKTMEFLTPRIDPKEKELLKFLEAFWETYKDYSAIQLSNATHLDGTPWKNALDNGETVISDDSMREYFKTYVH